MKVIGNFDSAMLLENSYKNWETCCSVIMGMMQNNRNNRRAFQWQRHPSGSRKTSEVQIFINLLMRL